MVKLRVKPIALASIVLLAFAAFAAGEPAIRFEVETHDFGKVPAGTRIGHTFSFENTGTVDLIIQELSPS